MLKIKTQLYIPLEVIKMLQFTPNGVIIHFRDGTEEFTTLAEYEARQLHERLENDNDG